MQHGRIRRRLPSIDERFTQVPNAWARDERLSFRARGILTMLLSHRDGWTLGIQQMTTEREGRDAIYTAVKELQELGYVERERARDDDGTLRGVDWILSEPVDNPVHGTGPETDL